MLLHMDENGAKAVQQTTDLTSVRLKPIEGNIILVFILFSLTLKLLEYET